MRLLRCRISLVTGIWFLWASLFGGYPAFSSAQAKPKKERPVVAIAGYRLHNNLLERQFRAYLLEALKRSERLELVAEDKVSQAVNKVLSQEEREASAVLDRAFENYLKGKKLYENLSIDEAISALNSAVRGYREGIASLRDNRYLLVSHLYLGMALIIRGRVSEGKEFIRQMIVLDPERQSTRLSRRQYPPKIVNLHASLTQEVIKGPSGTVELGSVPNAASVYFDGVQQPATPYSISNVPVGEHYFVFEKKGYKSASRRLNVKPGVNRVEETLTEWAPFAPYGFEKRYDVGVNEQLIAIGKSLSAPLLVLGEMTVEDEKKAMITAQVYDTRSKEYSEIIRVEATAGEIKKGAEKAAQKILENITQGGLVVAQLGAGGAKFPTAPPSTDPKSLPKPLPPRKRPFYSRWWFWAAIAGAGAVGVGVLLATSSSPDFTVVKVNNQGP